MTSETLVHSYAFYAGVYAMLQALAMVSLLLLGITIFIVSVKRAGANLHRTTLDTLVRAPLAFFSSTDTGVITNLFSQDLNLVDTELPNMLLNVLFVVSAGISRHGVAADTMCADITSNRCSHHHAHSQSVYGG